MKRLIGLILLLLVSINCFVSCSSQDKTIKETYSKYKQYEVLEIGLYDGFPSNAKHGSDIEVLFKNEKEIKLIRKKAIKINGEKIVGDYIGTTRGYLYDSAADRYKWEQGTATVIFDINKETGICDYYSWYDSDYLLKNTDTEKSREECLEIALSHFENYISDARSYTLVDEEYIAIPEYVVEEKDTSESTEYYVFEFVRKSGGWLTSDRAEISVTAFGKIRSHKFTHLGYLKDMEIPDRQVMDIVESNVDIKLSQIYSNIEREYDIGYELDKIILTKMYDGRAALEYFVDADLKPYDKTNSAFCESNRFIIFLE